MSDLACGPSPIREWRGVTPGMFDGEIRPLGEPAVLRNAMQDWPAVRAAKSADEDIVDFLLAFATSDSVEMVVAGPEAGGRLGYNDDLSGLNFKRGHSPLAPMLERLLRDRADPNPHALALQSVPLEKVLPGMREGHSTDLVPATVAPRIWIGNAIQVAVHADLSENLAVNVAGRRRFTLFPPEAMQDLYIGPMEFTPAGPPTGLVDINAPDLVRYPNYRRAAALAQAAELEPGDAIYIPFHWWHHVASLGPLNILINFWWNPPTRQVASPLDVTMLAMLTMRALPADHARVFAAMLRHYVLEEGGDPAGHIPVAARGVLGATSSEMLARVAEMIGGKLQRAGSAGAAAPAVRPNIPERPAR